MATGVNATAAARAFSRMGSLGVEEEFFIVDSESRPTAGIESLVRESEVPEPLVDRLDYEHFACIVETKTPVHADLDGTRESVVEIRDALREHAAAHGYGIAGAGIHPAARWRELAFAAEPRYEAMRERLGYPQKRNLTAGVHVHVGVDDPEKAIWITNEVSWFLPVMLALSANSPFFEGIDTGLASARANVFGALPNTGLPPRFDSFSAFVRFVEAMVRTNSIDDPGGLWYDVRPNTECGTVEIRMPDAQSNVEHTLAFCEYARALVTDLAERYEDGESPAESRRAFTKQNKWRALRYGHECSLLSRDGSEEIPLGTVVEREALRLDVHGIEHVYESESGAATQRRLHEEGGMDAVCEALRLSG